MRATIIHMDSIPMRILMRITARIRSFPTLGIRRYDLNRRHQAKGKQLRILKGKQRDGKLQTVCRGDRSRDRLAYFFDSEVLSKHLARRLKMKDKAKPSSERQSERR